MKPAEIEDEMLMAYADGELDAETAARVEAALEQDDTLAERLGVFLSTRSALKAAFDPAPPVSAQLEAAVRAMAAPAPQVVALSARRAARPAWVPAAMAACLALAVGLGAGWGLRGPAATGAAPQLALADGAAELLARLPSGESADLPGGHRLTMVASFADAAGTFCREIAQDGAGGSVLAVACKADTGWELRFALAAGTGGDAYRPASAPEALDAWLDATGAGSPLPPDAEAAALARLR
jgi:hypothetical protein